MVYLTLNPSLTMPLIFLAWICTTYVTLRVLTTLIGLVIELKQLQSRKKNEKLAEEFIKSLQSAKPQAGETSFVMPGYEGPGH